VAITAIKAQAGGMMLMAEWDWLLRGDMLSGYIRRPLKLQKRRTYRREQ
jgi:hypothetical protein